MILVFKIMPKEPGKLDRVKAGLQKLNPQRMEEEPIGFGLSAIKFTTIIPDAGGEQDNYMPTWKQIIREHGVDIAQPDIFYLGGITRTLAVARLAQKHGLLCVPHSANHSLVTVCTAHMWNVTENFGPFMEFSIEDQSRFHEMFSPALEVIDGRLPLPDEGSNLVLPPFLNHMAGLEKKEPRLLRRERSGQALLSAACFDDHCARSIRNL